MPELSVQLYSVREALAADFGGTLAKVGGFGYRQVEPYRLVAFADELRSALAENGLSAPTAHADLFTDDQEDVFAVGRELGISTLIVPGVDESRWQSEGDIVQIAADLNEAAAKAAEHGLRVGYHNHHFELVSMVDGRHGLEVLADHLAPEVVLEVDTYWAYAGGADVPSLLRRLGDRVVALHLKDGDGSLDPRAQVPVGSGSLPVRDFIAAAPDALRVVELDDSTGDLLDAVNASRQYLLAGQAA